MSFEIVIGLSILAFAAIAYAVSHLPKSNRTKYVDQKVKERIKTDYTIVLYI